MSEYIEIEMDGEYPTEEALSAIEAWPLPPDGDCRPLFEAMRSVWRWEAYFQSTEGDDHFGTPFTQYAISTGGWSGHEDMLGALERNRMVWSMTWAEVRRGGHYVFEVRHHYAEQPR